MSVRAASTVNVRLCSSSESWMSPRGAACLERPRAQRSSVAIERPVAAHVLALRRDLRLTIEAEPPPGRRSSTVVVPSSAWASQRPCMLGDGHGGLLARATSARHPWPGDRRSLY